MKFSRKIFNFIMSIIVLVTVCSFTGAFSTKALADDLPVKLYYTKSVFEGGGEAHYHIGYIAIKNLGYNKKVTVHYNADNIGNTWNDIQATYVKTNPSDGYEVWSFETPTTHEYTNSNIQYDIKYEVNGQVYWDNNNGQNYFNDDLGMSSIYVNNFSGQCSNNQKWIDVSMKSKILGKPDAVKVRYTDDNWTTYKDVNISLNNNDGKYEYWNVGQIVSSQAKQIQFSVCYTVNGVEYWDNNFGSNYTYTY